MPDEFNIPTPQWPDEEKFVEAMAAQIKALRPSAESGGETRKVVPVEVVKAIADIANHLWKAHTKMLDTSTGEVREEMKRVYRHVDGSLESLTGIGVEVKDHTGDIFDYGLPLKVITTQPTPGLTREKVIETIKPTIYWQRQIIQMGEVVIATPASTETQA
ncbi:hypothetical protein CfE428DRAFT_2055 [Chthoniobacter flavus Ellin428]|uniref:Uncharacterized protein n=1 Tax=Chthoniobacter flavus Ellin428 TaxID=497964 RepID=B4CZG7_9BACT|nr:hypothetical protein [Chthoniobacter flavus]EDY20131.1 hypothetical protein CfE428DRAFT_2055 [Chthoniobacter flavus Ellin428]TCO94030.1 hypothetical protein EV701_103116 [Chthoniobacter flavus]